VGTSRPDAHNYRAVVHAKAGEPDSTLPYIGTAGKRHANEFALLKFSQQNPQRPILRSRGEERQIEIRDLAAGDYDVLKQSGARDSHWVMMVSCRLATCSAASAHGLPGSSRSRSSR